MRQLDAIPFSNYSVSIWGLSIWLWMLPIKEIRLKMFQHERQPLKTTSGLLSPSSMRANPMAWQCRPAGEKNILLEWNLVSIRAHQHGEIPVMMCMRPSLVCPCTALADLCWIANGFHFCPGFCWHSVLTRVHRGQVCLLPSVVPLWNRKLLGMPKWWTRSWSGYCYWVENTWNISACDISSSSQGDSDGQNFQGLRAVVWLWLDFAFFLILNLCIWICLI